MDRSGGGTLVEVYPAAALARWYIDPRGYKTGDKAKAARDRILDRLEAFANGWLKLSQPVRGACVESHDALDAFVSALVARAAVHRMPEPEPRGLKGQAQREGWIHLRVRRRWVNSHADGRSSRLPRAADSPPWAIAEIRGRGTTA